MAGFYGSPWWLKHHDYKQEDGVFYEVFKVRWYAWPFVIFMMIVGNVRVKEKRAPRER
jgi:hypothetical protein